jgi:hypothetical protein
MLKKRIERKKRVTESEQANRIRVIRRLRDNKVIRVPASSASKLIAGGGYVYVDDLPPEEEPVEIDLTFSEKPSPIIEGIGNLDPIVQPELSEPVRPGKRVVRPGRKTHKVSELPDEVLDSIRAAKSSYADLPANLLRTDREGSIRTMIESKKRGRKSKGEALRDEPEEEKEQA